MTQPVYSTARTGWTINTQRQTQVLSGGGGFVPSVEVGFTTGAGVVGSVIVPLAQYTPDQVAALVDARAAQLDAIVGLAMPPAG